MTEELATVQQQQASLKEVIKTEEESGLKLDEADLREYKQIKQDVTIKSFAMQNEMALLKDQLRETQVGCFCGLASTNHILEVVSGLFCNTPYQCIWPF